MVIHGGSNGKESALNSGDQSREDPLEKEIATHSSILHWRIPWTEEPGRLQSTGLQRTDTTEWLTLSVSHPTFLDNWTNGLDMEVSLLLKGWKIKLYWVSLSGHSFKNYQSNKSGHFCRSRMNQWERKARMYLEKLRWLSGKEPACQCRKCWLDPLVWKIPWRKK